LSDQWDAVTYARFSDHRFRPFVDLVARIGAASPAVVVDLGCGNGSTTATLRDRWPQARLIGVDSSAAMLAGAAERGIEAVRADAARWQPDEPVDVLVSNAMFQWLPGHPGLLPRMVYWLAQGGWFALQVPGNFDAPSHRLMRRLAESPRWVDRLRGVLRHTDAVLDGAGYRQVLAAAGLRVDAWETTYLHELQGPDAVLDWVRGTGLRPVLTALGDDAAEFETEYAALLREAYPAEADGTVLFPFRWIFAVGHRAAEEVGGSDDR